MPSSLILSAFPSLGTGELVFILIIVLIIFGPKSLPSLGRALGHGLREFKSASNKLTDALDEATREEEEREREDRSEQRRRIEADKVYSSPAPANTVASTPQPQTPTTEERT